MSRVARCPTEHAAQCMTGKGKGFRSHVQDEHGDSPFQQRIRLLVRFPKICQNVFKFRPWFESMGIDTGYSSYILYITAVFITSTGLLIDLLLYQED